MLNNLWTVLFLAATVYSVYYSRKLSETTKDKASGLNSNEILHVVVPEFFSPIISGAIFYYSWKKNMPEKAKQANKYSWIVFGIYIFFGIILNVWVESSYK